MEQLQSELGKQIGKVRERAGGCAFRLLNLLDARSWNVDKGTLRSGPPVFGWSKLFLLYVDPRYIFRQLMMSGSQYNSDRKLINCAGAFYY